MNVSQEDIAEIKRQLARIDQRLHEAHTQQAVMANSISNITANLPNQIDAAVRKHLESHGRQEREVSGWVVSIISVVLFALFGTITAIVQIWG